MPRAFALLDDHGATAERPASRLYSGFVREHRCVDASTLDAMWARVDADLRAGLHGVLLADYEWGVKLLGSGLRAGSAPMTGDDPSSLRVLMFSDLARLSRDEVEQLVVRAAEQHWSYDGDYYFVSNNCAVETLKLLRSGTGNPRLHALDSILPNGLLELMDARGLADIIGQQVPA